MQPDLPPGTPIGTLKHNNYLNKHFKAQLGAARQRLINPPVQCKMSNNQPDLFQKLDSRNDTRKSSKFIGVMS